PLLVVLFALLPSLVMSQKVSKDYLDFEVYDLPEPSALIHPRPPLMGACIGFVCESKCADHLAPKRRRCAKCCGGK
ncbi:hypothetical protein PFISCL1PPCAC_11687, partial [Pristionchus fissidentatus]